MADDIDNIVRLEEARAKRRSSSIDPAMLTQICSESQAELGALIAEFNRIYAVVNEGGKAWVFRWSYHPALKREVLERIRFNDFLRLYENRGLTVLVESPKKKDPDEITKTAAQWWLQSPARRQYLGGVTFDPIGQPPSDYMNL